MIKQEDEHFIFPSEWGWSGIIDSATFEQILEMDDDEEEREFSRSIVMDFFKQAQETFKELDTSLYTTPSFRLPSISNYLHCRESKDLADLSAKGHFLKGSSATLGLIKMKDSCEKIQHFGARKDETGTTDEKDDEVSLEKLATTVKETKEEFKEAATLLYKFYDEPLPHFDL